MTGFEIAGIVLAVIPLVLDGLNAYPHSLLARFTRARLERQEFARRLLCLQSGLRTAMLRFLTRIDADLTIDQLRDLSQSNINGSKFLDVWNEVWLQNPVETASRFEHTIEEIKFVLNDMVLLLNQILKDTEIPDASLGVLREIIRNQRLDNTFSISKNFSKRFKFSRSDHKRRKLIERMKDNIETLNQVNELQALLTQLSGRNIGISELSHVPFLDRVRDSSNQVYHALIETWTCECHKSPAALLRLEDRKYPKTKENGALRFSLILTFEYSANGERETWAFRETEIHVDQRSDKKVVAFSDANSYNRKRDYSKKIDYSSLQQVDNLCQPLLICTPSYENFCLRLVLDEKRKLWLTESIPHNRDILVEQDCISLERVLSQGQNRCPKLDKWSCLALAVDLASSLLQLYSTPWLSDTWCNKSLFFPLNVEEPYVFIKFGESTAITHTTDDDILNPYLVALGILLLEIWVGTSFSQWIEANNVNLHSEDLKDRAALATKWLLSTEVFRNMVQDYAQVVQLCLNCSFTPIQPIRTLTDDAFREVVYRDIVRRLEMLYGIYTTSLSLRQ